MWRARDLTLFGNVLIIKSLGLSQLIYSASILNVPEEVARTVKTTYPLLRNFFISFFFFLYLFVLLCEGRGAGGGR